MYHVTVVGVEPAGWLKSLTLSGALRALKPAARALPGFKGAKIFRTGPYSFATLTWTESASLRSFGNGAAMRELEAAAMRAARFYEVHSFVCESQPGKDEMVNLWRAARHAAAA